jgi:hypothetical protein
MICLLKIEITNPVIPTSLLRKFELLTRATLSWISFNHFPQFTNLLLSFQRQSQLSQTFPRLTTSLGALGRHLVTQEASPLRVTNVSWMLDVAQSAQGLNSSA